MVKVKVKVKFTPINCREMIEGEQRYSYAVSLNSGLNVGGGGRLTQRSGRFTPGNDPVPYGQWASGQFWTGAEDLASTRIRPPILQPIASSYIDYANPARTATNITYKIVVQENKELERMWTQSVSINYGCLSPRTKENITIFSSCNSCPSIDWKRVPSELLREFRRLYHLAWSTLRLLN